MSQHAQVACISLCVESEQVQTNPMGGICRRRYWQPSCGSTRRSSVTCVTVCVGTGALGGGAARLALTQIVAASPALMPPWMSALRLSPMCTACAAGTER